MPAFFATHHAGVPERQGFALKPAQKLMETMQLAPYQLAFPAAAICLAMFAFNFMGDGLRDAFDPQMRK